MAFVFPTPTLATPATGALAVYRILQTLLSAGWSMPSSSDGSGNRVTSGGTGTGGLGNNYAWALLSTPDGLHTWSFQRGVSDTAWYLKYSPGAIFGAGTATQVPTAADQIPILGQGPDSAPQFSTWFDTNGNYNHACVASTTAPYFWASVGYTTNQEPSHGAFYDGLYSGPSNDPDAYVAYANTGAALQLDVFNRGFVKGTWEGSSTNIDGVSWPFYPGNGFDPDPVTNADEGYPLIYYDNAVGTKGGLKTVLWEATGNAAYQRPTGTTFTLNTPHDRFLAGFCIIPWDGSTVGSNYPLELPFSQSGILPTPPAPPLPPAPSPGQRPAGGAAVTQDYITGLLLGLFPPSWVPDAAKANTVTGAAPSGELFWIFQSMANNLGRAGDLVVPGLAGPGSPPALQLQLRLKTMTGNTLDLAATDFYGASLPRRPQETDASYLNRIVSGLYVPRVTRASIFNFLLSLTGVAPRMTEVLRPGDVGGYTKTNGAPFASGGKYFYNLAAGSPACYLGVDTSAAPFRWTHAQGGLTTPPAPAPIPAVQTLPLNSRAFEGFIETTVPVGFGAQGNPAYSWGASTAATYGTPSVVGGAHVYAGYSSSAGALSGYGGAAAADYGTPTLVDGVYVYPSYGSGPGFAYFGGWGAPVPQSSGLLLYTLLAGQLAVLQQLATFVALGINALVGFRPAEVIGAGDWMLPDTSGQANWMQ